MDAGPGVASSVDSIMEKVGLKDAFFICRQGLNSFDIRLQDIVDSSFASGLPRNPPVLKGVFERLYSDAIQRIQRWAPFSG